MNCTCGVEIAAQSSVGGKCARCAAKTEEAAPPGAQTLFVGSVPVSSYQDTTLAQAEYIVTTSTPEPVITYEDVKKAYEEEIGPVPTVRKKGK